MCKQIHKKLRARSGETLAEVLIALLIIALSSMLLVVMINTAGSINLTTRRIDEKFYEDLTSAEIRGGTPYDTGSIVITTETGSEQRVGIDLYGGDRMASYAKS